MKRQRLDLSAESNQVLSVAVLRFTPVGETQVTATHTDIKCLSHALDCLRLSGRAQQAFCLRQKGRVDHLFRHTDELVAEVGVMLGDDGFHVGLIPGHRRTKTQPISSDLAQGNRVVHFADVLQERLRAKSLNLMRHQ